MATLRGDTEKGDTAHQNHHSSQGSFLSMLTTELTNIRGKRYLCTITKIHWFKITEYILESFRILTGVHLNLVLIFIQFQGHPRSRRKIKLTKFVAFFINECRCYFSPWLISACFLSIRCMDLGFQDR